VAAWVAVPSEEARSLRPRRALRYPVRMGWAAFAEFGQDDVLGTNHDVPSQRTCAECHDGEPGRALGFSTVQLSCASPLSVAVPGTGESTTAVLSRLIAAAERDALGYLHANCGHCHNPRGDDGCGECRDRGCATGGDLTRHGVGGDLPDVDSVRLIVDNQGGDAWIRVCSPPR